MTSTQPLVKPTVPSLKTITQAKANHVISTDDQGKLIIPGAVTTESPHEIIALLGLPGSGKTTSCATFPNRLWLDFDHKLPIGETSIPFWDAGYCDSLASRTQANSPVNRRDAFKKWLRDNHTKLPADYTLILDSWTFLQNAFDQQTQLEEDMADKPNPFAFWKRKIQFSTEICEMLKACRCRVIVTFHESIERDEEGLPTGKIQPLMDGKFKDQLLGHFTDAWHQVCNPYERDEKGKVVIREGKRAIVPGFYWELIGSELFNTNTNPILGAKVRKHNIKMITANYAELQRVYSLD